MLVALDVLEPCGAPVFCVALVVVIFPLLFARLYRPVLTPFVLSTFSLSTVIGMLNIEAIDTNRCTSSSSFLSFRFECNTTCRTCSRLAQSINEWTHTPVFSIL